MNNSDDFICNVLIMGKTGTGKSTLLNYLCDKKIADTGTGKPVTGEGIYEYKVNINNQEVRLFDSWGIEAGKTERWKQLIAEALKEHGVQKSMEDWFHCVIYCIQAGGGRVEDIDSEIIQRFLKDGYHLTIILTKADQVAEDDEAKMKEVILKEISGAVKAEKRGLLKVVATCAEQKKTRSGETNPFGKEEAIATIFEGWKETIIDRMPKHVIGRICELIYEWAAEWKQTIRASKNISGIESENKVLYQTLAENAKESIQIIQQEALPDILKESVESCRKASTSLKNTFDVPIDDSLFDAEILYNTESLITTVLKGALKGAFILPLFVDFFRRHSEDNITTQKTGLCNFVDDIATRIKHEIEKNENQVAKIIEKALS